MDYIVVCISEFADRHGMHMREAYIYLTRFEGIEFLKEFYDVEHTLSFDDVLDDLVRKANLNCRVFDDKPTIEWAIFIKNNRDRNFTDFSCKECNLDCKYDVVVGPVANDTVGILIRQFTRGMINAEYLKKEFDFGRLTNQYTFHTEKAL